jgi:cytochrome oxidase Cu insertion factor (SCO1/SenC/PrrC family)
MRRPGVSGLDGVAEVSVRPTSSVGEADVPDPGTRSRLMPLRMKWILWCAALAIGVGAGAGIALLRHSPGTAALNEESAASPPVATWPAGARPAPDFRLTDQDGNAFSLSDLRGRSVIVTFLDPLCRNFCPLEARTLSNAVRKLPPADRPAVVSVSVNPWADSRGNFREDAAHWNLSQGWRWGVGSSTELAQVWRKYAIGVRVTKKTIAGVTVREITHTEAAYLIDPDGNERALLLYPFRATDVITAVQKIAALS